MSESITAATVEVTPVADTPAIGLVARIEAELAVLPHELIAKAKALLAELKTHL